MSTQLPPIQRRVMAAFGYMLVLCLVPLYLNKDDSFVAFHARQGAVLWIWSVLSFFSLYLPIAGVYFASTSTFLVLAGCGYGLLSVLLNKCWEIPFISRIATRL